MLDVREPVGDCTPPPPPAPLSAELVLGEGICNDLLWVDDGQEERVRATTESYFFFFLKFNHATMCR